MRCGQMRPKSKFLVMHFISMFGLLSILLSTRTFYAKHLVASAWKLGLGHRWSLQQDVQVNILQNQQRVNEFKYLGFVMPITVWKHGPNDQENSTGPKLITLTAYSVLYRNLFGAVILFSADIKLFLKCLESSATWKHRTVCLACSNRPVQCPCMFKQKNLL